MVHFVIESEGLVRPLCGDWGESPSWTVIDEAVTCTRCLDRLEEDRDSRDDEAPGPHDPARTH